MRRITRNERIRDIKPERERGPMVFKLPPRGDTEHDPMFPRLAGGWVSGLDSLPVSPTPATPEPVQELQQYYEQLPEPPEQFGPEAQHNHHVTMYWNWRIDQLEAKLHD
jgi:hypothetical protein